MKSVRVVFENSHGDRLAARLDHPVGQTPVAFALFAHCFTCSKNLKPVVNISRALCGRGIAVLRFDFTGLGESEGDFADTNFSSNVGDLVSAAGYLKEHYEAPRILLGHSLGGAAVLQAASQIPSARAVATIAAPSDPEHVFNLLKTARDEIERRGEAEIEVAGTTFTIKKQFLDDLEGTRMKEAIGSLRRALLVFHSPADRIVDIENAQNIFFAAKHPKSFVSLDRADHLLLEEADSTYVGEVVSVWASKYIDRQRIERLEPDPGDSRVVVRTGRERYRTDIAVGRHHMIADEPVTAGGTGLGASPYDYLTGALGACTSMTLRMYADRKKWPLHEIVVRLRHEKIHADDCADCETKVGKIDRIDREIELTGPLDDEQRRRLLEIADKCPVHRTLRSEVVVSTSIRASDS